MNFSNMSIQILPVIEEDLLYSTIDKIIEYIDSTGLFYEVGAMETTIEGPMDELLAILKKSQEICFDMGINRIVTIAKFDVKKGGIYMNEKIGKYRDKNEL